MIDNSAQTILVLLCVAGSGILFCLYMIYITRNDREETVVVKEEGIVSEVHYIPSDITQEVGVTAANLGGGIGIGSNGNVGIGIGSGLQVSDEEDPEKFIVVFDTRHVTFTIDQKKIYEMFRDQQGKKVLVTYKEVYSVKVRGKEKKEVSRELQYREFTEASLQ